MLRTNNQRIIVPIIKHNTKISIEKEFDLREKRLNLIYKILYVMVPIWVVLFISYTNNIGVETPIYCGLLAILTTFLWNILTYMFSEFKCLGLFKHSVDEAKENADNKFENIWKDFVLSLCLPILLVILNMAIPNFINTWTLGIPVTIGWIFIIVNYWIKNHKFDIIIRIIKIPIICYALFAVIQITAMTGKH